MLFETEVGLRILVFTLLLSTIVESSSFNQPKFCPNASWNPNGAIFANAYSEPYGLFIHVDNTVYVTEQETDQLQMWSSEGGIPVKTISYYLDNPGAIFVAMKGDIYVDNGKNLRVDFWTPNAVNGIIIMNVTAQCLGLFIDIYNTLYCAASNNHQVVAKSLNGGAYPMTVVAGTGTCGSTSNQLCYPNGIFVDTSSNLYVADYHNDRVQKFHLGQLEGQTVVGDAATGTIDLYGPVAVILDADNYLFITDTNNNRIVGSGPNGFRCLVGCSEASSSLVSQFDGPRGLAFDSYGNLFVADRENNRILKFVLATNSCGQGVTSTAIQTSSLTILTSEKNPITATQQIHNSFGRANGFVLHLLLWLVTVAFHASF